jgi:carbamoyl-phosphate synthase/aspartate carbamoyltransferase
MDDILKDLPAHFEASQIHIAGLITASYSGEDFSHYLATSSLGTWLKEEGIPAMYGVDTRALTKRIREEGSMLGKMLLQKKGLANGHTNGEKGSLTQSNDWREEYESVEWVNPNSMNLVAEGEFVHSEFDQACSDMVRSIDQGAEALSSRTLKFLVPSFGEAATCFMPRCGIEV